MRKPDLFDDIIEVMRREAGRDGRVDVSPATLGELFAHAEKKKTPVQPAKTVMVRESPAAEYGASVENREMKRLKHEVAACKKCKLHITRTNTVFGSGNEKAELMFIGEAPGRDEDAQGLPFVGKAGELLTRMINAMQFDRSEVYIANIAKCRPPDNRVPEEDEVKACLPYLEAQIDQIKPKIIVLLGATALKSLLGDKLQITKVRSTWLEYKGIKVMPTYHPSYLLRNPPAKKDVWEDLQKVMAAFGKTPAKKG